jgi:hypothetical protein
LDLARFRLPGDDLDGAAGVMRMHIGFFGPPQYAFNGRQGDLLKAENRLNELE